MGSGGSSAAWFRVRPVANGAAVQVDLEARDLGYEVADSLKAGLVDAVQEFLVEGYRTFLVNLAAVERIDSSGVGTLIAVHHQVTAAGGTVGMFGARPFVAKVLKMMRLDKFLSLYADADKALRALADTF